ncbi:hypothetical protein IAR50_006783 [Cryptococcus sp. DSM 104548]
MSTALLATPSSLKRTSPPTSSQPLKRPRHASASPTDVGDDSGMSDHEGNDDVRAKIARKEARVIRNRQSAQRSRNARKLHLQYLEKRVIELEAENQALKRSPDTSATPTAAQSTLSASPATSSGCVFNFAQDLGLPQLVGGGISLTSVAPPPANVQGSFEPSPLSLSPAPAVPTEQIDSLRAENAALKQRVASLENLVKQVVAVANLSGQSQPSPSTSQAPIDWFSVFSPPAATTFDLSSTLSPGLPPAIPSTSLPTSTTSNPNPASGDPTSRSLTREARCGPAAGEGDFDAFFGTGAGEGREEAAAGGEGHCGASQAEGLDIALPKFEFGNDKVEGMHGGEGTWEYWDEAMRVLMDGIEGEAVKEERWDGDVGGDFGLDFIGLDSGVVA